MEGGGEKERRGQGGRRKMRDRLAGQTSQQDTGDTERGMEGGGEEKWKDEEIDLLDRQFQQDTGDTERGMEGGGEREGRRGRRTVER